MSSRHVLFAAAYGSGPGAIDALRVLAGADRTVVAGAGLLHRRDDGRTTLQRAAGSTVARAIATGAVIGLAVGLGSPFMWATALIGAGMGWFVGHQDRSTEVRELDALVGELIPPGGYAVVALAERSTACRLTRQLDLAEQTRSIPIAGPRLRVLARLLARGNADITSMVDEQEL